MGTCVDDVGVSELNDEYDGDGDGDDVDDGGGGVYDDDGGTYMLEGA